MTDSSIVFTEASDDRAKLCISELLNAGSIRPKVYDSDGYRIILSLDPSGIGGSLEWHVSVSRDCKSVPIFVASLFGRTLLPHVSDWDDIRCVGVATHLWARK